MKTKLFSLTLGITLLMACQSKKQENQKQDPYSFKSFAASLPEKQGEAHLFNLSVQNKHADLVQLDSIQLGLFLPLELLNDLPLAPVYDKPIYVISRLNIREGITSLIYSQPEGDFNSESIFLANYDTTGQLLNVQALAYDFGGASTYYQLESRLDKGVFKFTETEGQRRPEEGQEPLVKEFSLELMDNGNLKPVNVSNKIIGIWTEVERIGGDWVRFKPCKSEVSDFEISLDGPYAVMNCEHSGETFSYIIRAIKESDYTFFLVMEPVENQESAVIEIELINREEREGLIKIENRYSDLYKDRLFINDSEKENTPLILEEGCNVPLELIYEDGVAGITFGMPVGSLNDVIGLRKITNQEHDDMAGAMVTFYNMEHPQSDSVYIRVDADGGVKYVERIYVYSPKYKTDRGIGVGSTLADISNNYEDLTIMSGDIGLIVYTSSFENIGFILDDSNYTAQDQEVFINDVPSSLKVISVYMHSITQND